MSLSHNGVIVDPIHLVLGTGYEPINRDHHLQNDFPTCHGNTTPFGRTLSEECDRARYGRPKVSFYDESSRRAQALRRQRMSASSGVRRRSTESSTDDF